MSDCRRRASSIPCLVLGTMLAVVCSATGCFDTGRKATDQLRSALSLDRVPEQYEPPVEEIDDDVPGFE